MKRLALAFLLSSFFVIGYAQQSIQDGIKHMENENYTAALDVFNSICKADPKNSVAYFYIGEVNYLQEDYSEAEKAYRKGLTINAQCAECYVGLGKLELDKGNNAEAEKNFSAAERINKKNSTIPGLIGDAYLYSQKPNANKAIEYLEKALAMTPKNARFLAHLGDAYKMAGNSGSAMSSYERAVEYDPNNAEAYIAMARIWAGAQQEALAIKHLEQAIRLSPNDARPLKMLYELYIRERNFEAAIPLLEKYTELIGTDIDAKVRLVKFLVYEAKDYDKGIEKGEALIKDHPDQYTLHRWLSWAYASKAKQLEFEKAPVADIVALYKKSFEHSNDLFDSLKKDSKRKAYPEDYDFWALSALKVGQVDSAAHIYRKYLESEPSKAGDIYSTLAKTYYDSSNYEQAIAYYKRKIAIEPLTNSEEYYLGQSYYQTKSYVEADSSFAKVVTATPTYVIGWIMRGRIARAQDPGDKLLLARPHFEKVVELAEADTANLERNKRSLVEAYTYLAVAAIQQANPDHDLAKMYAEKLLDLDTGNETALSIIKALKEQSD